MGLCWYYVFNLIRERYKAPNTHNLQERKFEKLASDLRKNIYKENFIKNTLIELLENPRASKLFFVMTKNILKSEKGGELKTFLCQEITCDFKSVLDDFEENNDFSIFYDFLKYRIGSLDYLFKVYRDFFVKQQIDIDSEIEESCGIKFDNMSPIMKYKSLNTFTVSVCARSYNFTPSSWTPEDPVDILATEIQTHGPHVVGGYFGRGYYLNPPQKLEIQINGRDVYAWTSTDRKKTEDEDRHMILLVGVEETPKSKTVFFIDPNDESDPEHSEKQCLYAMDYELLISPDALSRICLPDLGYAYRLNKEA